MKSATKNLPTVSSTHPRKLCVICHKRPVAGVRSSATALYCRDKTCRKIASIVRPTGLLK
jgi:hypothetical protein